MTTPSQPPPTPNTRQIPQSTFHPAQPEPDTPRLSIPTAYRVVTSSLLAGALGTMLGASHGGTTTALRFRAENSHRLPTTTKGWYFYHKTKNYSVAMGGAGEARKMGVKLGFWTGFFVLVEDMFDAVRRARARQRERERGGLVGAVSASRGDDGGPVDMAYGQDLFSSVGAGLVTAGYFSLWHRVGWGAAARMARMGFLAGFLYGGLQDCLQLLQGYRLGYVEKFKARVGLGHAAG